MLTLNQFTDFRNANQSDMALLVHTESAIMLECVKQGGRARGRVTSSCALQNLVLQH